MLFGTARAAVLNHDGFSVRGCSCAEINGEIIAQWSGLEGRSLEGNAYLSPHFIMPAARYLNPDADLVFVLVSRHCDGADELCGVGVFERRHGDKRFPLPYWRAYKSRHTFLTGILVDARFPEAVLDACFAFLKRERTAIDFQDRLAEGALADHMERAASRCGWVWDSRYRMQRAFLVPAHCGEAYVEAAISSRSRKSLRSKAKRLQQQAEVNWRLVRGGDDDCVQRFLELEHMGWKGDEGTSLLASVPDDAFFRAMAENFAREKRIFYTELMVGGQVIASTVNFISGKRGFAFKIGWNRDYAPYSPGMLLELELVRKAGLELPELELIDSGAGEGSYIETLWSGRYIVDSGVFRSALLPKPVLGGIKFLRHVKSSLRR